MLTNANTNLACKCGKVFSHRSSLSRHKKTCNFVEKNEMNVEEKIQEQTGMIELEKKLETMEEKIQEMPPWKLVKLTHDEIQLIMKYTDIMTGERDMRRNSKWRKAYINNLETVIGFIDRYGDDGYGDKPIEMPRVEYWLSHI